MPNNKICVYAICKNESQFVDQWINSMSEADCIVVYDTGSTDDTVEKIKSYSLKYGGKYNIIIESGVISPWRFDNARNESLKLIPPEYNILVCTDLDELLEPGWAAILRSNWIEGKHKRAIYKYSWSHNSDGTDGRVFQYDKIHSRDWIWKYPVHELLWRPDTNEKYEMDETLYLFDKIHLHHWPDLMKSRGNYLPLLELRAEENKEDWYGLIYLAHEYYYRGLYQKSIDLLNKILLNYKDKYNSVEQASCYLFMGDSYTKLNNKNNAKYSYLKAIDIEPTYRESYIGLANILIEDKQYSLAISYLNEALQKTTRKYTWLERDTSWSYEIFDLLDLAYYYNGDKKSALACAYKAYSQDINNERLKNNLNIVLTSMRDKDFS